MCRCRSSSRWCRISWHLWSSCRRRRKRSSRVALDSVPRVELVSPATDTLVAGGDRIPLRLTVTDDHGISRVEIQSCKQGAGSSAMVVQALSAPQSTMWNGAALLDLAPRDLQPGDALHVKVVAIDNSP